MVTTLFSFERLTMVRWNPPNMTAPARRPPIWHIAQNRERSVCGLKINRDPEFTEVAQEIQCGSCRRAMSTIQALMELRHAAQEARRR